MNFQKELKEDSTRMKVYRISKTNREFILELILLIILMLGILFSMPNIISFCLFGANLLIIYKVRANQVLFLEAIFFILYAIPVCIHYFLGIQLSVYNEYNREPYLMYTLVVQTIFFVTFACVLNENKIKSSKGSLKLKVLDYPIAYWFCIVGAIITIIIGKRGDIIFKSGGYLKGSRGSSALFEYCFIFCILAYIFSGAKKQKLLVLKFVFAFYIIKGLLYGARIEVLEMGILIFILFFVEKFSKRQLILLLMGLYFAMICYGSFRTNLSFQMPELKGLFGYVPYYDAIVNNESDVYYASTVIIASVKSGFVDLSYRINAALNFIIKFFVPGSLTNHEYIIAPYLQKNMSTFGGGGYYSAYWYFYLGWIGVLIGGWICGMLWNRVGMIKYNTAKWQIFVIVSLVMVPRWFAYTAESIIKIPLFSVIGYIFFEQLLYMRNRKINNLRNVYPCMPYEAEPK